jgi:hypothetical protein
MAVLAALSYRHVKQQLYRQSEARLQQANRALGHAIFERLLLLDATLKSITPQAILQLDAAKRIPKAVRRPVRRPSPRSGNQTQTGDLDGRLAMGGIIVQRGPKPSSSPNAATRAALIEASRALIAGLDLLARQRFLALEFVGDDGRIIEIFGRLSRHPTLASRDSSDLKLGLPLIATVQAKGDPSRIYLLRRLVRKGEIRGTFVGEVSPEYLWGTLDVSMPSATTRVAVLDDSANVLFRSSKGVISGWSGTQSTRAPVDSMLADSTARSYLSASSKIALNEAFAAPPWSLVLSESKD